MGVDSLDVCELLRALVRGQVPVSSHEDEVVVVEVVICLGTEAGAHHPPGGQDCSGTVVTSQTLQLIKFLNIVYKKPFQDNIMMTK